MLTRQVLLGTDYSSRPGTGPHIWGSPAVAAGHQALQ